MTEHLIPAISAAIGLQGCMNLTVRLVHVQWIGIAFGNMDVFDPSRDIVLSFVAYAA